MDKFHTARIHYKKAINYLYHHPVDEANSVKEVVSSLESITKTLSPNSSTLGQAISSFKRKNVVPPEIASIMDKIYAYSNSTPLVRHGHSKEGAPSQEEAELIFAISTVLILYVIKIHPTPEVS